jgi:GH35 family endo-1,4-beta-xylanase
MYALTMSPNCARAQKVFLSVFVILVVFVVFLQAVATTRAQTLPSITGSIILNGDALDRFKLMGRQEELAQSQVVDVTGKDFKQAIRVSSKAGAQSEWNVQLFAPIDEPAKSGDVLLARFWMRCTESMTGEGFVGFVYEISHPEFDKAVEVRLAASGKWKEYFVPFRAARDFPAGETRVCLRVGYDRQTIEIGGLQIVDYGKSVELAGLPRTRVSYAGRSADAAWRRAAQARIDKNRKGDLRIIVTDSAGKPVENATVHARLARHAFGFGSCVTTDNLLDPSSDGDHYRQIVEKYFNLAVFENDMKWQAVYDGISPRLDQSLQWLLDRHIDVRGHNLVWPSWRWLPAPLKQFESQPDKLREITTKHITDEVSHFKGKLFQWDVVNEPYTNHDLINLLGGQQVMADWFKLAHAADPDTRLFLNDYGILEGGPDGAHSQSFYESIKYLKDNSTSIGGIGIQSHFAAALPSPMQLLQTLDKFSELGLPIELTELSLNLDDRDLQADYMRDFLTVAFSHPNVNGVMLWGFWEKRHWRPQGALFNADWSIRPHGQAWIDLVDKQWRTDVELQTDKGGAAGTRGFLGTYEITVSGGGKTNTTTGRLERDGTELRIALD